MSARTALLSATCNGSGLITLPSPDGPWHTACHGCRNCTPAAEPIPAQADPFARLPQHDDEGAF